MDNPTYLTPENVYFNGANSDSVLIKTVGVDRHLLVWSLLSNRDHVRVDAMIQAYGGALPIPVTAGEQTIGFGGAVVGGDPTGLLNDSTVYIATVLIDGSSIQLNIVGSSAQTFTALLAELDSGMGGSATSAIVAGDIVITSSTSGNDSSVIITDRTLLSALDNFVSILSPLPGADDLDGLMNNWILDNGTSFYSTYSNTITVVGTKPNINNVVGGTHITAAYWDGAVWRRLIDDALVT